MAANPIPENEEEIQRLESQFPKISGFAFSEARRRSQEAGHSVFLSEDGAIYEVFPDGRRQFVKNVEPPIQVKTGLKIHIP